LITTASNLLPVDGSGYFIHYVEYGTTVQKAPGATPVAVSFDNHNPTLNNPWISYLATDQAGGTNNEVQQTLYNTSQFYEIEKPNVYYGINATPS